MHPLVVAALLLLQTWTPDVHQIVSEYRIEVDSEPRHYAAYALCDSDTIVLVKQYLTDSVGTAGILAHEAKHLEDGCPTYKRGGITYYYEAAAYRYQLLTVERLPNPGYEPWWAEMQYWKFYWRERLPGSRSLGILPNQKTEALIHG